MTPENFVYWLQGFFEITGGAPALNEAQTKMVKEHLEYVFQNMAPTKALPIMNAPRSFDSTRERLIC